MKTTLQEGLVKSTLWSTPLFKLVYNFYSLGGRFNKFIITSGVNNFSAQVKESKDKSRNKYIYSLMYMVKSILEKETQKVST